MLQAKTKEELRGDQPAAPGDQVPSVNMDSMGFDGSAGSALHKNFNYAEKMHTEADILRPGYFNDAGKLALEGIGLDMWDTIEYTVGGPAPCDAYRGILVVEKMPGTHGIAANTPLTVAIVQRFSKATLVDEEGVPESGKAKN